MADSKLVEILKQGSEVWNRWRGQQSGILVVDLRNSDLRCTNLSEADLRKASLNGADLSNTDLRSANLSEADLHGADLHHANLHGANLSDTNLSSANLCWAHLDFANISISDLSNADLSGADLSNADLGIANLRDANLSDANLRRTNLRDANLRDANLHGADLRSADLRGTELSGVNLVGVRLSGATLQKAQIWRTVFAFVDLRKVKGLAEIYHGGSSHVELHTVQLPQDGSAFHFLRGAGVPDEWIDFYRTTMMHPIQYHSCFISYSSQDSALARRLHADLQDRGVRCWFAPEDMKIGDKIRSVVDQMIHQQEKFLLLLSIHSINSNWVEDEVEIAWEKERSQAREMLFPVRLDDAVMHTDQPWAAKLRRARHIGDFTNWTDPQAYEQAFERLLRDLKA